MKIKYKPWAKGLMYLVEAVVIILSVFPILWVVMSSFKTNGEILSSPLALPAHFSLDTFIEIFQKYSFPTYFFNSLLAAGVSTLVSLLFYAMGAYVIAKFEFPGRKLLFALFTITLLVPSHSKTQPIFSLITKLNLYDSIWGVTLVYLSAGMAMSIFVLKAGFMAIPKSLDEAATLDGASVMQKIRHIDIPSILPIAVMMLILECGKIMGGDTQKALLLQTKSNTATSDIIGLYVYNVGLGQAKYSYTAAIGLFQNLIGFVMIVVVNTISKRVSSVSMF